MTNSKPIIVGCSIVPYPRRIPVGMYDKKSSVKVLLDNGEEHFLFDFYSDEITFTESEFIGLTLDTARRLKYDKDVGFIRSYLKTN